MILALRTDKPEAELYLLKEPGDIEDEHRWLADRELADSLLRTILEFLSLNEIELSNLQGIIVFKGPGSFTGLRIGASVANAIAYSEGIPIVGSCGTGWLAAGASALKETAKGNFVVPEYGAPANVTKPRK